MPRFAAGPILQDNNGLVEAGQHYQVPVVVGTRPIPDKYDELTKTDHRARPRAQLQQMSYMAVNGGFDPEAAHQRMVEVEGTAGVIPRLEEHDGD